VPFVKSSTASLMAADVAPWKLVATPAPLAVEPTGSCAASWGTMEAVAAAAGLGLLPEARLQWQQVRTGQCGCEYLHTIDENVCRVGTGLCRRQMTKLHGRLRYRPPAQATNTGVFKRWQWNQDEVAQCSATTVQLKTEAGRSCCLQLAKDQHCAQQRSSSRPLPGNATAAAAAFGR
jgi:hypothetical protein